MRCKSTTGDIFLAIIATTSRGIVLLHFDVLKGGTVSAERCSLLPRSFIEKARFSHDQPKGSSSTRDYRTARLAGVSPWERFP